MKLKFLKQKKKEIIKYNVPTYNNKYYFKLIILKKRNSIKKLNKIRIDQK